MRPAREPRATESVPAYEAGALVSIGSTLIARVLRRCRSAPVATACVG